MEEVHAASKLVESTLVTSSGFAKSAELLAAVIKRAGEELRDTFGDRELSKEDDQEARAVAEVFVAWKEVGEAQVALAARLLEVCEQLRTAEKKVRGDCQQRLSEASRLQQALSEAEAARTPARGWLGGWFGGGSEEDPKAAEVAQQKMAGQRAVTAACMEQVVVQLKASKQSGTAALLEAITDLRRHAKSVGEKVSLLKPSWRGSATRGSASAAPQIQTSARGKPKKVEGLIRSLTSGEKRPVEDAECCGIVEEVEKSAAMIAPSPQVTGKDEWRIKGVYEHQVLKAGLRQLDEQWPTENLLEFPKGALFREKLMTDLMKGKIRLQSVPNSDVSAAQRDVHRLTLRQLLRLRVLHLDFTPSGCGSNTCTGVGGTHEAFLGTLDGLLFQSLGRTATAGLEKSNEGRPPATEEHRLGREAIMIAACAINLQKPSWWVWWISGTRRCYFNGTAFASQTAFPAEGVLEVTDLSKADRSDPTGRLRWLDWRADHVREESKLADEPKKGNLAPEGCGNSASGATDAAAGGKEEAPEKAASAGAATAAMVNPELLKDLRSSLRKTSSTTSPKSAKPEGAKVKKGSTPELRKTGGPGTGSPGQRKSSGGDAQEDKRPSWARPRGSTSEASAAAAESETTPAATVDRRPSWARPRKSTSESEAAAAAAPESAPVTPVAAASTESEAASANTLPVVAAAAEPEVASTTPAAAAAEPEPGTAAAAVATSESDEASAVASAAIAPAESEAVPAAAVAAAESDEAATAAPSAATAPAESEAGPAAAVATAESDEASAAAPAPAAPAESEAGAAAAVVTMESDEASAAAPAAIAPAESEAESAAAVAAAESDEAAAVVAPAAAALAESEAEPAATAAAAEADEAATAAPPAVSAPADSEAETAAAVAAAESDEAATVAPPE